MDQLICGPFLLSFVFVEREKKKHILYFIKPPERIFFGKVKAQGSSVLIIDFLEVQHGDIHNYLLKNEMIYSFSFLSKANLVY